MTDARCRLSLARSLRRIDAADARCREHEYGPGTVPGHRTGGALAAHHSPRPDRGRIRHPHTRAFTLAEIDPAAVTGVIISSVVPPLNPTLEEMSERYFHVK